MLSMTGYGAGASPLGGGRLTVEMRAVNHRYLDLRLRLAPALTEHGPAAEEIARRRLMRGRVELIARLDDGVGSPAVLDVERARQVMGQLAELRDELAPGEALPLSLLGAVPDLFVTRAAPPSEQLRQALEEATTRACDALTEMRGREGEALGRDLQSRVAAVRELVGRIGALTGGLVVVYRLKLHERIEHLLSETDVQLDPGRLEHEIAVFADRSDVTEELTRLASHCDQFRELAAQGAEPVGRRLDFLLQEFNRETNTIGSKCADAKLSRLVVELKAEVERMREQVQNIL